MPERPEWAWPLVDDEDRYHGSLSGDAWSRHPSMRVEGGYLIPLSDEPVQRTEPGGAKMLLGFAGLADASEAAFVRYAERWGMLHLCGHDIPRTHPPFRDSMRPHAGTYGCELRPSTPFGTRAEPISVWRGLAREARDLLTKAADRPTGPQEAVDRWWTDVEGLLPNWIRLGGVRPQLVYWLNDRPQIVHGSHSLFGALATRLLYTLAGGGHGLRLCDNPDCTAGEAAGRAWYTPARLPGDRRGYCPACQADRRVRNRMAQRDYRERRRASLRRG